jgi:hypothetical protein
MSKSIVYGLLAFAVSSSLLVAQDPPPRAAGTSGMTTPPGGWTAKPGQGITYDGGELYSLRWVSRLQVHWTFENIEDNPDVQTFDIRRARTGISGHVFKRELTYMFLLEATDDGDGGGAANGPLKQGWANYNFSRDEDSAIGVRVGQAKTLFGYEATGTSAGLWFVERSFASRTFADSYSRGAWLNGVLMQREMPVRFAFGVMNTDVASGLGAQYIDQGEETPNSDNELSYVLSANIDPIGDFHDGKQTVESRRQGDWRTDNLELKGTIGAGVALGNGKDAATGGDIESMSLNLNTAWAVNHLYLAGEYFMRTDDLQGGATDEEEPSGFSVSGGYLLDKSGDSDMQWGIGLRYSMAESDDGDNGTVNYIGAPFDGDISEISVVLNAFYHGHSCKTQFEWTLQDIDPSVGSSLTNHIFRVAFQIEI